MRKDRLKPRMRTRRWWLKALTSGTTKASRAATMKKAEIGRVKNSAKLPSVSISPRRRLVSTSGPRIKPRMAGATGS